MKAPRGGHGCASPGITEGVPTDTSAEVSRAASSRRRRELHLVHLVAFLRELRAVRSNSAWSLSTFSSRAALLRLLVARPLRALQLAAHLLQHARLRLDGELALLHRGGFGGFAA